MTAMTEPIEWRIDAANNRVIRLSLYAWIGLWGGAFVVLGAAILAIAVAQALAGDPTLLLLVGLFALVGGPLSLVYLWPALRHSSVRPLSQFIYDPAIDSTESLGERYARVLSWRSALGAVIGGALILPALLVLNPWLFVGAVAGTFASVLLTSFVAWGRLDPATSSLEYGTTTVPLEAVRTRRSLEVGGVEIVWLSYHRGSTDVTTPSLLVLPAEATAALDEALASAEGDPPERETAPGAGLVLTVIGLALVLVGLVVAVGVDGPLGPRLYIGVVLGLVGAFLAWIGYGYG